MIPNRFALSKLRFAPALYVLLALALLISQGAAQAHVYSHLANGAGKTDFSGTATQVCDECLASAPLLGAAGPPDSLLITFDAALVAPVAHAPVPRAQITRHYAFRSRAPPELL